MGSSGVRLRRDPPLSEAPGARLVWSAARRQQVFRISGSHRIGRHPANDLQLLDVVTSKVHCEVELRGAGCYLRDLASLNGTYLNGRILRCEQQLFHGDAITVGNNLLWFEGREPEAPRPHREEGTRPARFVEAVRALLEASHGTVLLCEALRAGIDLVGADWGALFELAPDGASRPEPLTVLAGTRSPPARVRFDAAVVELALRSGQATERVEWTGNVYRAAKPRSLIAIPLSTGTRAIGVLWLEREGASKRGSWAEVELLGRLAAVAAVALVSAPDG